MDAFMCFALLILKTITSYGHKRDLPSFQIEYERIIAL